MFFFFLTLTQSFTFNTHIKTSALGVFPTTAVQDQYCRYTQLIEWRIMADTQSCGVDFGGLYLVYLGIPRAFVKSYRNFPVVLLAVTWQAYCDRLTLHKQAPWIRSPGSLPDSRITVRKFSNSSFFFLSLISVREPTSRKRAANDKNLDYHV